MASQKMGPWVPVCSTCRSLTLFCSAHPMLSARLSLTCLSELPSRYPPCLPTPFPAQKSQQSAVSSICSLEDHLSLLNPAQMSPAPWLPGGWGEVRVGATGRTVGGRPRMGPSFPFSPSQGWEESELFPAMPVSHTIFSTAAGGGGTWR